jgi:pyruvate kinase
MATIGKYPQLWFTYGPRTSEDSSIAAVLDAGATGSRLTFSFGTPELQVERAEQIRRVAAGRPVYLVADLQGEKCRLARLEDVEAIAVEANVPLVLTGDSVDLSGKLKRVPLQVAAHVERLTAGDVIVEGDGALTLRVTECRSGEAVVIPLMDGVLHPGRGLTVRGSFVPRAITAKDHADLAAVAASGVFDAVAVSFAASRRDIDEARKALNQDAGAIAVIAKIETVVALERLEEIAEAADCLMAARGDLALALPWEELPAATARIADIAKRRGVPWILATQLMEGLERFTFPTRAEICDLAHWMSEGAHGAMLSYETAFGPRPNDAIACASKLINRYARGG